MAEALQSVANSGQTKLYDSFQSPTNCDDNNGSSFSPPPVIPSRNLKVVCVSGGEVFICTLCGAEFSLKSKFDQHVCNYHLKHANTAGSYSCSVCNVYLNSIEQWDDHLQGARHRKNATISSSHTSTVPQSIDLSRIPRCLECNLICSSEEQLADHLKGKKHARQCKKKAISFLEHSLCPISYEQSLPTIVPTQVIPLHAEPNRFVHNASNSFPVHAVNENFSVKLQEVLSLESKAASFIGLSRSQISSVMSLCSRENTVNSNSVRNSSGEDMPVVSGTRRLTQELKNTPQFCEHSECAILRALQHYVNVLEKTLRGPRKKINNT